jgi:hypothetical protein
MKNACGWSADRLNERPPFDCDVVDEERITGAVAHQAEADLGHSSANANGSGCLEVDAAIGIRSSGGLRPHCLPCTCTISRCERGGRGSRGRGKEAVSCLGKSLCKMRLGVSG